MAAEEDKLPPEMMFRKTKSNNFFAVDDSLDQIQPFEDDTEGATEQD